MQFIRDNRHALAWSVYLSLAIWVSVVSLAWTIPPWATGTKTVVLVVGFIITTVVGFYQLRRVWSKLENKQSRHK